MTSRNDSAADGRDAAFARQTEGRRAADRRRAEPGDPTGYRLLLVEDNAHHAELVRRRLERAAEAAFTIEHVERLADALQRLSEGGLDAVLLDLILPDSPIDQTLASLAEAFPNMPVVVLASLDDLEFAARTVKQGAQDYLVKSQLTGELLFRSVRYAVERKKSEDALRRYAADLERSNADLKQFSQTVAHEVKSPLGVVAGCLAVIREEADRLSETGRDLMNEAVAAIDGMAELVDELLTFASAEHRGGDARPVDLEAVFFQAFVALRPEIKAAGARITHDPLPIVRGDALQLRHVLQNLIGNALKYRSHRTPEIHVGIESHEPAGGDGDGFGGDGNGGGWWRLCVRDNGIGIPADHAGRVFDMFYRVHAPAGPNGTGIGLAFCRRIVGQHGGRIWVDSEPGRGSTFHLTLPAAPDPHAASPGPRTAAASDGVRA